MKSTFICLSVIFLFAINACEKDKLEGDSSILIGTWNWTETFEIINFCDPDSTWNYQLIDFRKPDNTYALEFFEKGKVFFYHNDAILWKERIVFQSVNTVENGAYAYHFVILLNNNSNDKMEVWAGQDSLLLNDFPEDTDENCLQMFNHFIRQ